MDGWLLFCSREENSTFSTTYLMQYRFIPKGGSIDVMHQPGTFLSVKSL